MRTWRSATIAATAAALLVLTTACGQGEESGGANSRPAGNAAAADGGYGGAYGSGDGGAEGGYGSAGDGYGGSGGEGAAGAEPAGRLAVRTDGKLGELLTDSAGFTLYRFDRDTADPPQSNCDGDCAKAWPVVLAEGAEPPPGVEAALIGSVRRADGAEQLTVDGHPMYRYAEDKKPGDSNGQGVGGAWYAAAPDGSKAAPAPAVGEGAGEDVAEADRAGLSTRRDPELGEIVVDRRGMTVYRFTKDSAWPMKSACTGDCLVNWPVVEPVDKSDTAGILRKGFVTFERPDGLSQQTIDCWPLYTHTADKKPGDTNGQGAGGTWYAVSPQGKLVGAPK
ncbi:SCO0930 family lipoprotein [Streptomyces sp. KLOTTS4A1]|uniref:SCO0930 family lipoprotein n=1 Tax=Streptomyces sp. KLOTTS4A1 TaxID=3390996 RepID=UPI0039F55CB2